MLQHIFLVFSIWYVFAHMTRLFSAEDKKGGKERREYISICLASPVRNTGAPEKLTACVLLFTITKQAGNRQRKLSRKNEQSQNY